MNRVGEPDDIGGLCIYLSSPASSWITGALIPLDGGALIAARMWKQSLNKFIADK